MTDRADEEFAVLGLGRSGVAAAKLLLADAKRVYISDSGASLSVSDAARQLADLGASVDVGDHDLARIARAAKVVVSPGIDPEAPAVVAAREAGRPLVSEIEIALGYLSSAKIIAVTGTNGKTTTTAMIGHILRSLGESAVNAGNIGAPLADFARRDNPPAWIALEMSSFQLHDTPGLRPHVGVLTNLTPDHLDRYSTADEYYADKALMFANANNESRWVINNDDARVVAMSNSAAGRKYGFSVRQEADAWLDDASGTLYLQDEALMPRGRLNLLGDHNVGNALAAALAVASASDLFSSSDSRAQIADALSTFKSLPHRMEIVGETKGVQWINDSKATNVSSSMVAIAGMRRPTILLLGGRHKGEAYTSLGETLKRSVKRVIAYGEAADLIEEDLTNVVQVDKLGSDFEIVVDRAREIAEPGDAVLLSPACSSYDMFVNYEDRGERFKHLAMKE